MTTTQESTAPMVDTTAEKTDGYHLVLDALKLNDVRMICGAVGIPITDLARVAQASGTTSRYSATWAPTPPNLVSAQRSSAVLTRSVLLAMPKRSRR